MRSWWLFAVVLAALLTVGARWALAQERDVDPHHQSGIPPGHLEEDDWEAVAGLELNQAEELLDWLERQGCAERELRIDEAHNISVRWRRRPKKADEG